MTEAEWLVSDDPEWMLEFVRGTTDDRKLRLFACACCRHIWHLITDERSRRAVELAEAFADGAIPANALTTDANAVADRLYNTAWDSVKLKIVSDNEMIHREDYAEYASAWASACAAAAQIDLDAMEVAFKMVQAMAHAAEPLALPRNTPVHHAAWDAAYVAQADAVRDIVGNPFRPVALDPAWRTEAVVALAAGIYEERAFERLPVLADALDDAGCADADVQAHCRGPGPHARGCWVVDLILGKE